MTFAESISLKLAVMHYVLWTPGIAYGILYGLVEKRGENGCWSCVVFFYSLPEDGIQVPKHVADIL
jgi:hypothetical protein